MANNTFSLESIYNWYKSIIANPKYRWWVIGATLLYLVSPIDFIPDMIPFIGQIDDAVVVTLLVTEITTLLRDRKIKKEQPTETAANELVDVNAVEVK